jgi:AcrR family transcriptional regulator
MPKVVDYEQKKQEIAHKALYVFAYEGYHRTTMAQIAAMCHIGRSTIYEYFRNKDEIFTYTLNQCFDAVELDFQDVSGREVSGREVSGPNGHRPHRPPRDAVESISAIIGRVLANLYRDKRILLVLLEHTLRIMREDQDVTEQLKERAMEILDMFAALLEEGMRRGEVRELDPQATAATLGTLIEAAVFQFSIDTNVSLDTVLRGVQSMLQGLRTPVEQPV